MENDDICYFCYDEDEGAIPNETEDYRDMMGEEEEE